MKSTPKDLVFVCYSHRDKKWLERLRVILKPFERQGLKVWADPYIKVGQRWKREIDAALKRTCVAVLLVSPDFLASDFIYDEELPPLLKAADKDKVTIVCIPISASAYDQTDLDRYQWARDPKKPIDNLTRPRRNKALVEIGYHINEAASGCESESVKMPITESKAALPSIAPRPDGQVGAMFGVPSQRPHYLPRPELQRLKNILLSSISQSFGISGASSSGETVRLGLHGMGGIGKTVLAIALAHDEEVRRAFPDGIIWVTAGQQPDLESLQGELLEWLTDQKVSVENVAQGRAKLTEALTDKACLLILDDIWNTDHAAAFGPLGPKGRLLITTRNAGILTALGAQDFRLEVLSAELALALLSRWSGQDRGTMPPTAESVAKSCGYLPLALALAGAHVRDGNAWKDVSAVLEDGKLEYLDHPYGSIFASLQLSIDVLKEEVADRYKELAIFPEDVRVPEKTVLKLWSHTAGLQDYESRAILNDLQAKGLLFLSKQELKTTVGFHDLQQDFLQLAAEDLPMLHNNFLNALDPDPLKRENPGRWAELSANETYLWYHLAEHLLQAERDDELRALLTDVRWLQAKLAKTDVNALISDYRNFPRSDPLSRIGGALRLSAHVLTNDPLQLASQLTGRLLDDVSDEIKKLLKSLKSFKSMAWLRPMTQSLISPGGPALRTLSGHTGGVTGVAVSADGRQVISGSDDKTLKVWDLESGNVIQTLSGHTREVTGVAVSADGRQAVSGSKDHTLKVWDLESGRELQTLSGHTGWITGVAVSADGRQVISGSLDNTLKVWDLESGKELQTLSGHTGAVYAVTFSADGRQSVSGSLDNTLKVWDLEIGKDLQTLSGHTGTVSAVLVIANGRQIISGSWDKTLRVWDLESGQELQLLSDHKGVVNSVAVSADGRRVVSGSSDRTLKVWDLESGQVTQTLHGHTGVVNSVAVSADGRRVVSGSLDKTLKVWNFESDLELQTLSGDTGGVSAVAVIADDRQVVSDDRQIVSVSWENNLKVWDLESGQKLQTLSGHTGGVSAVAVSADGRQVVSGSWDKTVKVWNIEKGSVIATFFADGEINTARIVPDGVTVVAEDRSGSLHFLRFENLS